MTTTRIIELRMLAAAHPGNRSSGLINELCDEVERLQTKIDRRQQARERRQTFNPPCFAEVAEEFERLGLNGEAKRLAQAFISHYESNGWKVGKVRMQKWRAACQTWKRNHLQRQGATPGAGRAPSPQIARTGEPKL